MTKRVKIGNKMALASDVSDIRSALGVPEPSYGPAAARYSAERELGRRVLEMLRERAKDSPAAQAENAMADVFLCEDAARALGLLGEEVRP